MKLTGHEGLNFFLTNRIPRRLATSFIGRFSRIEQPFIRDLSIAVWRLFADIDLSDARETRFRSMHDLFTRHLKPGARIIDRDPAVLASPCDAIVGATGRVEDGQVLQVKGFPYALADLLCDPGRASRFRNGCYVTLRLTSGMYHRFHAPCDGRVTSVTHVPGDAWNVNPPALRRVDRLFCRNERAVLDIALSGPDPGQAIVLVPVAAILVAGIRLRFLDLSDRSRHGPPQTLRCDAPIAKGDEMGWFEHGSTILVFAPETFRLHPSLAEGTVIRVGQPLMTLPETPRRPLNGP